MTRSQYDAGAKCTKNKLTAVMPGFGENPGTADRLQTDTRTAIRAIEKKKIKKESRPETCAMRQPPVPDTGPGPDRAS